MRTTARQRVLAFVRKQPGASPEEIGRGLGMSAATVRHHLGVLGSDGRVVRIGAKRAGARGRPSMGFRASDRLLGDNLAVIADSLLQGWPAGARGASQNRAIRLMAKGLLSQFGTQEEGASVAARLGALVGALNAAHYDARWEAGAEGPRVVFDHCPYSAIIGRHPELCQMDRRALGEYMQAGAAQIAKIDPKATGSSHCIFVLGSRITSRIAADRPATQD